jgi:hypothetical protein
VGKGEQLVTSTRRRAPLTDSDRLILAARFEQYLSWRHVGPAMPRSAKETADRIGWQPHTVAKRCENIRDRYSRLGVPGLRGRRPGCGWPRRACRGAWPTGFFYGC